LFTVSRALTVGRRSALFTVAGNELGGCVQVAGVASGVGALVERSAEIFTVVKSAGAAYLVLLGGRRSGTGGRWPRRWSRRCGRCVRCAMGWWPG